eukprot:300299-Chlamydomonas_euryale.AAC.1
MVVWRAAHRWIVHCGVESVGRCTAMRLRRLHVRTLTRMQARHHRCRLLNRMRHPCLRTKVRLLRKRTTIRGSVGSKGVGFDSTLQTSHANFPSGVHANTVFAPQSTEDEVAAIRAQLNQLLAALPTQADGVPPQ